MSTIPASKQAIGYVNWFSPLVHGDGHFESCEKLTPMQITIRNFLTCRSHTKTINFFGCL